MTWNGHAGAELAGVVSVPLPLRGEITVRPLRRGRCVAIAVVDGLRHRMIGSSELDARARMVAHLTRYALQVD